MSNQPSRLNLDQLEEIFDEDDYTQNQQQQEFDSAVKLNYKVKKGLKTRTLVQSSSDTVIHENLNQSPKDDKFENKNTAVRCSFGINSQQKIKFHIPSSNQSSVNNSLQFNQSPKESQGTAQFPNSKKFGKLCEDYHRNTIEELTEQESSINQSREIRLSKASKKINLTIETDEGIQEYPQCEEDDDGEEELEQEYYEQNCTSQNQLELCLMQMVQNLERVQEEKKDLSNKLAEYSVALQKSRNLNKEITDTLDETQHQLMKLHEENQTLKKKLDQFQMFKPHDDQLQNQQITTFISTEQNDTESTYNSRGIGRQQLPPSQNRGIKQSRRSHNNTFSDCDNDNKENHDINADLLNQITRLIKVPNNNPQQVLKKIKQISYSNKVLEETVLMLSVGICKSFVKNFGIDEEGKEASMILVDAISSKQVEQVEKLAQKLVNIFERKLKEQYQKQKQTESILTQIQKLVVVE